MVRYLCSIVILLFVLESNAQVRTPVVTGSSETSKVFRVEVNLVQVDAVVTDKKGRPVTDLTADDFIVYQDGKRQEITSFSMVRMDVDQKPAPPAPVKSKPVLWTRFTSSTTVLAISSNLDT